MFFGNYVFYFGNYFVLWFQLEVETFQVGVGCPCRGGTVGLKYNGICTLPETKKAPEKGPF